MNRGVGPFPIWLRLVHSWIAAASLPRSLYCSAICFTYTDLNSASSLPTHIRLPIRAHHFLQFRHRSCLSRTLRNKGVSLSISQIPGIDITCPASTRMLRMCFQQLVYCARDRDLCSHDYHGYVGSHLRSTVVEKRGVSARKNERDENKLTRWAQPPK